MCCEVRCLMRSEPRVDGPKLDRGEIIIHILLGSRGWEGREKILQEVGGEGNVNAESSSGITGHKQGREPQKQEKELSKKKMFADLRGSGSGSLFKIFSFNLDTSFISFVVKFSLSNSS